MSISITADLAGNRELIRKLDRLKSGTARKIVRPPVRSAASVINKDAKKRAPVETGLLKRSLGIKSKTYKSGNVVSIVGPRTGFAKDVGGKRRDPSKYGHLVEFGHRIARERGGKSIGQAPPKPFLRPAFEANKSKSIRVMAQKIARNIIKEAMKR